MSESAAPTTRTLPPGFEVRLRDDVIHADRGAVLVGGSPVRAVRLSRRARVMIAGGRVTVDGQETATLARRLLDGNLADPVLDTITMSPTVITVVVPVRDRPAQLARCLAALAPLPVLVVDDASADPGAVAGVARRYGATLVALKDNLGPAGARNAGLALVRTALVAFVDSDVVADATTLLALARHCADPQVALVGPAVVGEPRSIRPRWFERYDAAASSLDLGRVGGQVRPGAAVGWLPSACLVGRAALLGKGFDASLRVAEDVDLVWRLVDDGLAVRYDPAQVARHDVRRTVREWLGRKFVYGTGGAELSHRHGGKVAPAVLAPVTGVAAAAVLQRRWWSLPVAAAAVGVTARSLHSTLPMDQGALPTSVRLSLRGLGWAVRQESALLLRHWWPLATVGALVSRSVRRTLVSSILVDLFVFQRERQQRERQGVGLPTAVVARRCDDLAYGAGLWWGAIRRRSMRCLAIA